METKIFMNIAAASTTKIINFKELLNSYPALDVLYNIAVVALPALMVIYAARFEHKRAMKRDSENRKNDMLYCELNSSLQNIYEIRDLVAMVSTDVYIFSMELSSGKEGSRDRCRSLVGKIHDLKEKIIFSFEEGRNRIICINTVFDIKLDIMKYYDSWEKTLNNIYSILDEVTDVNCDDNFEPNHLGSIHDKIKENHMILQPDFEDCCAKIFKELKKTF